MSEEENGWGDSIESENKTVLEDLGMTIDCESNIGIQVSIVEPEQTE